VAIGGSYRAAQNAVIKASLATGLSETGSKTTSYGVGASMSW
jgi:YadA-like membrane anchor domain